MKTKRIFEASDIDLENQVHRFLDAQILLLLLSGATVVQEARKQHPDNPIIGLHELVAQFLTHAEEDGIAIVKAEVPAVYKEAT